MGKLPTLLFLSGVLWTQVMFLLGIVSNEKEAPRLIKGKLSKCPNRPNCACSEFENDDRHYIEPVAIPPHLKVDLQQLLKATIKEISGCIHTETESYIAATFSSPFFRFVDDLEIRIDRGQNRIHFRSASRVGYSDAGVNRKRIELVKSKIIKAMYIKSVFSR